MSNPLLSNRAAENYSNSYNELESMTVSGTILKTSFLFAILVCTSLFTMSLAPDKAVLIGQVGLFGGFIVAMIICFARKVRETNLIAPTSMLYAGLEGLFIGSINAYFIGSGLGTLVVQAIVATFGAMLAVLFLYSAKIIRCTEKFRAVILASMLGILVVYLVTWIMSLLHIGGTSALMNNGAIGIGFSIFVCVIAALNLIIDFDMIENASRMNLSKNFEWYSGFSLMVTLIWLYIEILRLLSKLNSRN